MDRGRLLSDVNNNVNGDKQQINSDFEIHFKKIYESIQNLKRIIPEVLNDEIINIIYNRAMLAFKTHRKQVKLVSQIPPLIASNDKKFNDTTLSQNEHSKKISNQQRCIIIEFCKNGYGYNFLQSAQTDGQRMHISPRQYDESIFRIFVQSFKKLEQFLITENLLEHKGGGVTQERWFYVINNCRKIFSPQICEIYYNVIKGIHFIEPYSPVTKEEALILYKTIKRTIQAQSGSKQRCLTQQYKVEKQEGKAQLKRYQKPKITTKFRLQKSKVNNQAGELETPQKKLKQERYELHKRWNDDYEQLLLELYKRTPNISRIRDRFQLVYFNNADLFSVQALRSKLYRILRVAIKLIFNLIKENRATKLPSLMRLDDTRIKMIINNREFRKVRLLILDIYSKGCDQRLLNQTINKINLYVSEAQNSPNLPIKLNPRTESLHLQKKIDMLPLHHPKQTNSKEIQQRNNGKLFIHRENSESNEDNESIYNVFG